MANQKEITLRNFLIKYTAIPIKFINEHLKFYESCDKNIFGIDLFNVIKYLNVKKKRKIHAKISSKIY